MRFFGFFLLCWTASLPVRAEEPADSLSVVDLAEVEVKGVRASKAAPFAVSEVNGQDLDGFSKTGRELPFLFSRTPGVLAWSENGMGTGTTYLRVRGSDDTHVNVTLDGIPLNSPEDQRVFWANMNSYASLLGNVQIQRGVGTSSNGDGAFGSTVAMSSRFPSLKPSAEITGSWGSYGTWRAGGNFSTGLLARHWVMDGAYHETSTNGYVHGTAGRQGSYYGGLAYLGDNFMIRYKNFGNFEKTGQAWNGVTAGSNDLSLMDGTYGMKTGVRTYKDLFDAGLGRYNSLTECLLTDEDGNFIQDADGNYQTGRYRMRDGSYWKKTTDNFYQNHNLLSMAWNFRKGWTLHGGLHYTYGYGYYTEFRPDNKLKKFGISNYTLSDGTTLKRTDFVRKKGLTQHTYGMVWDVSYTGKRWDFIGGMSLGQFEGNHFGRLTYIANEELSAALLKDGAYDYYHSNAYKKDDNAFAKATWHISGKWDAFADVQFRHVRYKTNGINDKFYEEGSRYYNQQLDVNACYNFLNPKAGVTFHHGGHRAYASVAVGHREPARNNFTDNGSYPAPEAERLTDWEVGYQWTDGTWSLSAGAYFMDYTDQLVQTGEVSDIGEALTTNIKDSYRTGLELAAAWRPLDWLSLEGNAALSINKIKDFDEVVEDWANYETGTRTVHYDNSTLAFSPAAILNGFADFHYKGWQAVWHTGFVSRQYLDNTACKERALPAWSVSSLSVTWTWHPKKKGVLKELVAGGMVDNMFNRHYAAGGWVYSAICESYGHGNDNRYYQIGFIPMAGTTLTGHLTLRF